MRHEFVVVFVGAVADDTEIQVTRKFDTLTKAFKYYEEISGGLEAIKEFDTESVGNVYLYDGETGEILADSNCSE